MFLTHKKIEIQKLSKIIIKKRVIAIQNNFLCERNGFYNLDISKACVVLYPILIFIKKNSKSNS